MSIWFKNDLSLADFKNKDKNTMGDFLGIDLRSVSEGYVTGIKKPIHIGSSSHVLGN